MVQITPSGKGMQIEPTFDPNERLWTEAEAAEFLGFSFRGTIDLRNAGKLPFLRLGRSIRYRPASLRAYVERLEIGAR